MISHYPGFDDFAVDLTPSIYPHDTEVISRTYKKLKYNHIEGLYIGCLNP